MLNIFITGSTGFIGNNIKLYLKENSNNKLFTPTSKELNLHDTREVDDYVNKNSIDIIIHCANKGGDKSTIGMKDIVEYNLRIFFNIAKQSNKVKKILHLGSGAEYCKHKPIVDAKEIDSIEYPKDGYGFYKKIASDYIENSDNIINLRIFGCYGIGEDYSFRFISQSIVKNLLNIPIVIDRNVVFNYTYVNDVSKVIDYFINNNMQHSVYNLTNSQKIDLISIVKKINDISGNYVTYTVKTQGLNNEYSANNDRLTNEIKNLKFTSYEDSILEMIQYFRKNLSLIDISKIK